MATRIPSATQSAPDADAASLPDADAGIDDLSILHPDVTLNLAGREVIVREYGFVAGMAIRVKARPLVQALQAQFDSGEALTEDILDVLAAHAALVRELIATSAGVEPAWIDALGDTDGEQLQLAWWKVCGFFFVRQIVRRLQQRLEVMAALAGPISMPSSAPPDTDPSTLSDGARSVN